MSSPVRQRGFLLSLAAEALAPLVTGCARALTGAGETLPGAVLGTVIDRAVNRFGPPIAARWADWLGQQSPGIRQAALADLADHPPSRARIEASGSLEPLTADASAEDRAAAVEYLCALPRSVARSLVLDPVGGGRVLPAGQSADDPTTLLAMLPVDAPPYPPGSALPETSYLLGDLLGSTDLVVYRASSPAEPDRAFALKFCTFRSQAALLRRQRDHLHRLATLGGGKGSERLVRLIEFDLEAPIPF